eukprot:2081747-Amphidinium_carterae.1
MHPPPLGVVLSTVWYNCRDGDSGEDCQSSLRSPARGFVCRHKEAMVPTGLSLICCLGDTSDG